MLNSSRWLTFLLHLSNIAHLHNHVINYLVEIMGVKLYIKPFVYKEVGLARLYIVLVKLPSSTNEVIER